MKTTNIDNDAFSSGQIKSKLWACEQLELLNIPIPAIIWLYGGWHGMLAFLLLSRNKFPIKTIRSFDLDTRCENIADTLLENWVWQEWKFKAFTADCNHIQPLENSYGGTPDIIINTSTEHFESTEWFDNIPQGTTCLFQSNNMPHDDHVNCFENVNQFSEHFKLDKLFYSGELGFKYPSWGFKRFMIIGKK
jgi:hypothetical protein